MADFNKHIEKLISKEGGYVLTDDPDDRGGRTFAGISERANPDWPGWELIDDGCALDDPGLIRLAHNLYRDDYWQPIRGDGISSDVIVEILFSSAVLEGARAASMMAQRALGFSGRALDGIIGRDTLKALEGVDPDSFTARFALARIHLFCAIVKRNRSQLKYLRGWTLRVIRETGMETT